LSKPDKARPWWLVADFAKHPPESQGSSPSLKNDDMHGTPTTRIVYPKALPWLAAGLLLFFIALLIGLWFDRYPALEARLFDENGWWRRRNWSLSAFRCLCSPIALPGPTIPSALSVS